MKPMSKLARIALIGTSLGLLGQAQAAKYGVACITNSMTHMASFRAKTTTNYAVMSMVKGRSLVLYRQEPGSTSQPISVWLDPKLQDANNNQYYDVQLKPSDTLDCKAGTQYEIKTDASGKNNLVKR